MDNSVHVRLYRTPRMSTEEKVETDVLITTLSSLREIFVGLDFEDENVIDLDELKTRLITPRSSSRAPSFHSVGKMFAAMDEDGVQR